MAAYYSTNMSSGEDEILQETLRYLYPNVLSIYYYSLFPKGTVLLKNQ